MKMLLNADLGEGEPQARTSALMKVIDLANIACGGHAGTVESMEKAIRLASQNDVALGAHPGLAADFGRGSAKLDTAELELLIVQQVGAIHAVARRCGARLHHVKLHGAMYHATEQSPTLARAYVAAVKKWFSQLRIVALAGGRVVSCACIARVPVLSEAFLDRAYLDARHLVPRDQPGALLSNSAEVADRVRRLRENAGVLSNSGVKLGIRPQTLCVHSDSPDALRIARAARRELDR